MNLSFNEVVMLTTAAGAVLRRSQLAEKAVLVFVSPKYDYRVALKDIDNLLERRLLAFDDRDLTYYVTDAGHRELRESMVLIEELRAAINSLPRVYR